MDGKKGLANCLKKGDWEEGAKEVGEEHDTDCDAKSQVGGGSLTSHHIVIT